MNQEIYGHFHPEEHAFVDKAYEWVERAAQNHAVKRTDFLDPRQAWIVESLVNRAADVHVRFEGGYPQAERRRAIIAPDYIPIEHEEPGVKLLAVSPADKKFLKLEHGDYLGAILGLGIKRGKIGDIQVIDEGCHCMVAEEIGDYVRLQLHQVHRTNVQTEFLPMEMLQQSDKPMEEMEFTVASLRLDAVVGDVYRLSRAKSQIPIKAGKCRINWKTVEDPSAPLKEGDVISLQGFGRSKVLEVQGSTKKGRIRVRMGKYQ